jgi:hypothetical protein
VLPSSAIVYRDVHTGCVVARLLFMLGDEFLVGAAAVAQAMERGEPWLASAVLHFGARGPHAADAFAAPLLLLLLLLLAVLLFAVALLAEGQLDAASSLPVLMAAASD